MFTSLRSVLSHRRSAGKPPGRRVLPPTTRTILVEHTDTRQTVLAGVDRSPSLFRLRSEENTVAVWMADSIEVGSLSPALATGFRPVIEKAGSRGQQIWVHGQVERHGVDLCVVLHCPLPAEL